MRVVSGQMEMKAGSFVERLSGSTIRRLLAQEHWYADELSDPFNVLFAELDENKWVRFFFDAGVFFWTPVESPTLPEQSGNNRYLLTDLSVSGAVTHATVAESFDAALLEIHFADSRVFQLHNSEDRSWIGATKR